MIFHRTLRSILSGKSEAWQIKLVRRFWNALDDAYKLANKSDKDEITVKIDIQIKKGE